MVKHLYKKVRLFLLIIMLIILAIPAGQIQARASSMSELPAGTIPTATKTTAPTSTTVINKTSTLTPTIDKSASATVTPTSTKIPTSTIKIVLDMDIRDFTKAEQDKLLKEIATALNLNLNDIRIIRIEAGSVIVTVEIPSSSAQQLVSMHKKNDSALKNLHISSVEIIPTATPTFYKTYGSITSQVKPTIGLVTPTYPMIVTKTPTISANIFSSGRLITTFLLILGGVFILAILGIGGFLLLRPR